MVASVGIAATAFLLTLQPALAFTPGASPANNILARQSPSFDPSKLNFPSTCTDCPDITNRFSNSSCATIPSCVCSTSLANSFQGCLACVVATANSTGNGSTFNQSDAANLFNEYTSECAKANLPVTGVSSLPGSTATPTAAASHNSGSTASKMSIGTFGVMITAVLGAIALL